MALTQPPERELIGDLHHRMAETGEAGFDVDLNKRVLTDPTVKR